MSDGRGKSPRRHEAKRVTIRPVHLNFGLEEDGGERRVGQGKRKKENIGGFKSLE